MYRLNFCQGEASEHVIVTGDGKSGKTSFVRDHILKRLPSLYKVWAYDYNHNGFQGIGTPIRSLNAMLDANVQYLPQVKDRKEMDAFVELSLRLGNRIAVLDEYHTQQNAKYISPLQARFLRTFRHVNGSWIVIAQSPLDFNEAVFSNHDHIFAFFMSPTNRHIKWYVDKFGKKLTAQLIKAHTIALATKKGRPYIHKSKGMIYPKLYTPGQNAPDVTPQEVKEIVG